MKQSTGRWLGDSNRTGSNDVSVKIPSKAVTSTCINLESTEKKVNVVLYQEPNKILSNSNNTITNSTLQEPPIEEKDKSEKVLILYLTAVSSFIERAKVLFAQNKRNAQDRWTYYKRLSSLDYSQN